jgi:peptidoglycan/LPS O-acetylase OafA/YrhL
MAATQPQRLDALTGIRPFASAFVFLFHFGRPLLVGAPRWQKAMFSSGFIAVSFFYVLSGFVLTFCYRERLLSGALDVRRFLIRRISRIYPAYALALLALIPLALSPAWGKWSGAFHDPSPAKVTLTGVAHALMIQAWWPPLTLTWNLPGWSVSVEFAFYLVFPALAGALVRRSPRQLWLLMAAAWAFSLALSGAYVALAPDHLPAVNADTHAAWLEVLKFWPPARLPELVFGVALGALFALRRPSAVEARLVGGAALATLLLVLAHADAIPYPILHNALLLPVFGGIIWAAAGARGAVGRALKWRPLRRLGQSSYDIYILQMPLVYWVLLISHYSNIALSGLTFMWVMLPLLVGVALLVSGTLEQRGRAWLERWLETRTRHWMGAARKVTPTPEPSLPTT